METTEQRFTQIRAERRKTSEKKQEQQYRKRKGTATRDRNEQNKSQTETEADTAKETSQDEGIIERACGLNES